MDEELYDPDCSACERAQEDYAALERVGQRIKRYLRQLAPHQNEREGPQLMREALAEIERLRDWIRHDSEVNDTCTFHVLGEICQGCGCPRKVPND